MVKIQKVNDFWLHYSLNPSVFYQAAAQKSSCCAHFIKIPKIVLVQCFPILCSRQSHSSLPFGRNDSYTVMPLMMAFLWCTGSVCSCLGFSSNRSFCFIEINPPLLIGIQRGILEYNFWKNFKKIWKVYSKSGLRIPIYRRASFDRSTAYGKRQVFFCLRARFAYGNSKLTFVIFHSRQSWWGFRSPFPRYAQNLGFWLSGSTWMCSQPNAYGLSGVASQL